MHVGDQRGRSLRVRPPARAARGATFAEEAAIRAMADSDLDQVVEELSGLLGDRDFTRATFSTLLRSGASRPLVAEIDGRLVGAAAASCHGQAGWVGHMVVAPEHRGRGIGGRLTAEAVQVLRSAGCATVLLAATPLGQPVYRRLGFVVDGWYRVFTGEPGLSVDPGSLRALDGEDLEAILGLDRQATGEDRSALLRVLGTRGWVERDAQGAPRGYCLLANWGRGPVIALDSATAVSLLHRLLHAEGAGARMLQLPAGNRAGCRHLARIGLHETARYPRMRLGPRVTWQPRFVWRIASFAVG